MVNHSPSLWLSYATRLYGLRLIFWLLLAIQLYPVAYYYINAWRLPYISEFVYQGISILSWSSIPVLLIALIPWLKVRQALVCFTLIVYGFLMLFEGFLVYSYSSVYTDSIALNILATNPNEASSFLENLNYKALLLPLFILVLLLSLYLLGRRNLTSEGKRWQIRLFCAVVLSPLPLSPRCISCTASNKEFPLYGSR